jgi:hypothetical protein
MSAVVKFVGNAISKTVEAVGSVVQKVAEVVVDTVKYVAENPEVIIIAVAAPQLLPKIGVTGIAVQPVTAGLISASQGGSVEDIGKAALGSFVGQGLGTQVATKVGTAINATGNAAQTALANAAGGAVGGAAGAAIVGGDVGMSALTGGAGSAAASLARSGATSQFDIDETGTAANIAADVGEAVGRTAAGGRLEEELLQVGLGTITRAGQQATRDLLTPTDADIQAEVKRAAGVQTDAEQQAATRLADVDELITKAVRDPSSKVDVAQAAPVSAAQVSTLSNIVEQNLVRNLVTQVPASTLDKIVANSTPLQQVLNATERGAGTVLERILTSAEGRAQLLKEVVANTPDMAKKYVNRATVESLIDAGASNAARALVGIGALAAPGNIFQQTDEDRIMAEKVQEMIRTGQAPVTASTPAGEPLGMEGVPLASLTPVEVTAKRPEPVIEVGRNIRPDTKTATRTRSEPFTGTLPQTTPTTDTAVAQQPATETGTSTQPATDTATQTGTQTATQTATSPSTSTASGTRFTTRTRTTGGTTGGTSGGTTGGVTGDTSTPVTELTGTELLAGGEDDTTRIEDDTGLTEEPVNLTELTDQELIDYLNQEFPLTPTDTEDTFEPLDVRPARVGRSRPMSISPRVVGTSPVAAIVGEKEPIFGGEPDPQQEVWNERSLRLRRALGL